MGVTHARVVVMIFQHRFSGKPEPAPEFPLEPFGSRQGRHTAPADAARRVLLLRQAVAFMEVQKNISGISTNNDY